MSLAGPVAADPASAPHTRLAALGQLVLRYGATAIGPIAVSGAHFLASLVFLKGLAPAEFGLFSFVIVAVSFCMSMSGALVALPVTTNLATGDSAANPVCFKFNWAMCLSFGVLLTVALLVIHAPLLPATLLGLFGATFTFRWTARCYAYVDQRRGSAIASDALYSAVLLGGLGALLLTHSVSFLLGSEVLLWAAIAALAPFGRAFMAQQLASIPAARLRDYIPVFRDTTRWALSGVILTEVTVNAHAYLVTFLSGPKSFALLALGMLLMRPAALVQNALPDMERPAMARAIAAADGGKLTRLMREMSGGLMVVWLCTILLCAALLIFAPGLLLKKGYALHDVVLVAGISAVIMLVRGIRAASGLMLQAAGAFKTLAHVAAQSALVSLTATAILLFAFGPLASLGGILLGDLVVLVRVKQMAKDWRGAHV